MLTKDQANAVARSMLEAQHARDLARSNRRWDLVPEMRALDLREREEVVSAAKHAINRSWVTHLAVLSWVAAYALVWYFLMPETDKRESLPAFVMFATTPVALFYGMAVRRKMRRLAAAAVTSATGEPPKSAS